MKTITLKRIRYTDECSFGVLRINRDVVATLEDAWREEKIYGETAIPAGTYELKLRNEGGMTARYYKRYPDMHRGMIWLQDVPNFTFVYIHVGNYPKDTYGCILVGNRAKQDMLEASRKAYKRIYPKIVKMIETEGCQIEIIDTREDSLQ